MVALSQHGYDSLNRLRQVQRGRLAGFGAYRLDGVNDLIELPSSPTFGSDQQGTIMMWANVDTATNADSNSVIGKGGNNSKSSMCGIR